MARPKKFELLAPRFVVCTKYLSFGAWLEIRARADRYWYPSIMPRARDHFIGGQIERFKPWPYEAPTTTEERSSANHCQGADYLADGKPHGTTHARSARDIPRLIFQFCEIC